MSPRVAMLGAARRGERQQRRSNGEKQKRERLERYAGPAFAHRIRQILIRRSIFSYREIRSLVDGLSGYAAPGTILTAVQSALGFLVATALELAAEVAPHFAKQVLAGRVCDYSFYAKAIGRTSRGALAIGKAMHAIGGTCVLCKVPIAPLYYVQRADGKWPGVFEIDSHEREHVLPHFELLYDVAKTYTYTAKDFRRVERGLREVIPKFLGPADFDSPHKIWQFAIYNKLRDSNATPLSLALDAYRLMQGEWREEAQQSASVP